MFEARNILKKQSKFCMFNVDNFLLNDENSTHSMNIITQSLYNLVRLKYKFFLKKTLKYACSTYIIFQRMLKFLCIQ